MFYILDLNFEKNLAFFKIMIVLILISIESLCFDKFFQLDDKCHFLDLEHKFNDRGKAFAHCAEV